MNILVVDDREENRYLLEVLLKGNGHAVLSAANGAEAMEKIEVGGVEMVISDILMPVMDGFQLCRKIKTDEHLRRIPFIIYTATYTGPQDEVFAKKIGADRFIIKPCEPDVVMNAVRETAAAANRGDAFGPPPAQKEEEVLKLYNERLVRKLEQKMLQAEKEVAARREAEEALRQSEEKHRRLFETMVQGVIYQDGDGKVVDANPAALRMLGLTLAQMQGRTSGDWPGRTIREDGADFPDELHPTIVALRTGRAVEDAIMGIGDASGGSCRWIKIDAIPLFKPGGAKPHQVYTTFDDITERKRAEEELREILVETTRALALAIEKRDPYTAGHQERVAQLAVAIGVKMGLPPAAVETVRKAATLHDIGKIGVPSEILSKPTTLNEEERAFIRTHSRVGYEIINQIRFRGPVAQIVCQHHERLNGSGYPDGLKGEEILLEARVIAVADVVEAMAHHRPYRAALGLATALEHIAANRLTLYDPDVVEACQAVFRNGFVF